MKANDRARLTTALRDHVAKIAADLRAKVRAPGAARVAAEHLHKDERVAEDFEVWTDLLSRRAAVLWVLKSVYVRVLEDRGLLTPGRLLDAEAQQLFEKLAPNLGETAFLRWIYKDLASSRGGVPELFSPQPAEVALPSDELSRALIAFWRHRDADSGAVWSFAEEHFEGELMGDLYQELDPVVKDRFALCQTPDFVRAFILDRTLTPAIENFGADEVRLLDPACGSGHFLIDGLKRLVAATAAKHADWDRAKVVAHALDRVVGIDINDYACALARTRLIMTAAELAGVAKLADAARFHPHVYWADGLEQVEKEEQKPSLQYALFEKVEEKPRATLTRPETRQTLRKVLAGGFHAVLANPPYHGEPDPKCRDYHRERVGKRQRYASASGRYTLATVFFERCLQLARPHAHVGAIIANSFTNKAFGRAFIEDVLSAVDLRLVADTSGAILAASGFETTTLMLFALNQPPASNSVRVVSGKSADRSRAADASTGDVWTSIASNWDRAGFENEFVCVDDLERVRLDSWPWMFSTQRSSELRRRFETGNFSQFGEHAEIGVACVTGEDACFILSHEVAQRLRIESTRELVTGDRIRDWATHGGDHCVFPYDAQLNVETPPRIPQTIGFLWRYRRLLRERRQFGTPILQKGMRWFELQELYLDKIGLKDAIVFPYLGTHNHFALADDGRLFKNTAFVAKLTSDEDPMRLLGSLNSSAVAFWIRQRLSKAGGRSSGTKRQSEPWAQRLIYSAKLIQAAPICADRQGRLTSMARALHSAARELASFEPRAVLEGTWDPASLGSLLVDAQERWWRCRNRMVAVQEELDWAVYREMGLVEGDTHIPDVGELEPLASEHRPFAILLARAAAEGRATRHWFEAMCLQPQPVVPESYSPETRARIQRRIDLICANTDISVLEVPEHKRKWEPIDWESAIRLAAFAWLAARLESAVGRRDRPLSLPHIAAAVQDDPRFLAVAVAYEQRRDVDLFGLVGEVLASDSVPSHPFHVYTESGLVKRSAWEDVWQLQRREDAGEDIGDVPIPREYSQGSRGKSTDFLCAEYWRLRGKLDVPTERFIAFTEVPGRSGVETLYGWAGWTAQQRVKAILAIDEELEDASVPLADRIGLLDSAWRLLPDAAREDAAAATRLKAELQALVGPEGPSRELVEDWKKRFPPPTTRSARAKKAAAARDDDESESEESDE